MSRLLSGLVCVCATFIFLCGGLAPTALAQNPKDPVWTHAFDVACRKYGEPSFSEKTQKFAFEVFKDPNTNYGIYVSQIGSLGVAPGFDAIRGAVKNSQGPKWLGGLDLPSRKAGEKEFSKDTHIYSLERFRDPNAGNLLYVTEHARIAVVPAKGPDPVLNALKPPTFHHSIDLRSRKAGNPSWRQAPTFGIEIWRDEDTANLIYLCDTGAIAVVPDAGPAADKAKKPVWLYGLELPCHKHNEPEFGKAAHRFALEVFRDESNGNLIYLCESGSLAVVRAAKNVSAPTPKVVDPPLLYGLNLKCRAIGEKEFTDKTRVYGAEVFRDDNTGVTLYIAETGSVSAVPSR